MKRTSNSHDGETRWRGARGIQGGVKNRVDPECEFQALMFWRFDDVGFGGTFSAFDARMTSTVYPDLQN
jgi:hypothetical protein